MKKFLSCIILILFVSVQVFAIDLDTSVDDAIRQNYKSNQLVDEVLPELPKILQQKQIVQKIRKTQLIFSFFYSFVSTPFNIVVY